LNQLASGLIELADPRRYGDGSSERAPGELDSAALRLQVTTMLERGDQAGVARALRAATSHADYAKVWQAVCDAANHDGTGARQGAVVARTFALPLVIIAGSRRPASVPGVVPDVAAIARLFTEHGALGPALNFGLGNALCSLETVTSVTPVEVHAWTRDPGAPRRELPPAAIEIAQAGEHVHLRYLVGAAISPAAEPSFVETASNIGVWGMPLTRALALQLGQPDVEVLPLARPPLDILRAGPAGRYAQLETAFNLFVSNSVRRLRAAGGDPDAVISAHDDGDIRIVLTSPFDESLSEGFRWPLHPLDDITQVAASISDLLAACRVTNVRCAETVLPALNAQGLVWFARAREVGQAAPAAH
jgi:hypothetical protein